MSAPKLRAARAFWRDFAEDDSAVTASEYAVMLALLIMAMMIAITSLGTKVSNMYTSVTDANW